MYISKGNNYASKDENTLASREQKKETFTIEHHHFSEHIGFQISNYLDLFKERLENNIKSDKHHILIPGGY